MSISIPTVDGLDVRDLRVFYRVDYNVPVEDEVVGDATRIEETIPTLLMLRERGARIVVASHFGRPKGKRTEKDSLRRVRDHLAGMLNLDVAWSDDCVGEEAERLSKELGPGQILVVENLRFHAGEESNDAEFARELAKLGDAYVNDAFGACHRAHASIVALPALYSEDRRAGGLLLARELEFLQKVTNVTERPFVAILGGAKIAGKIEPLGVLVSQADTVLIGGGMANTFLAAQGTGMGGSLVDRESLDVARGILNGSSRAQIVLPSDFVVTDSIDAPSYVRTVAAAAGLGASDKAVDIGPETVETFKRHLEGAKVIFWNGPMGVFEHEQFARGTIAVAAAVAAADAVTIVGGGESVDAVKSSGFGDRISHISTGGGASLEFIAGAALPGVEVLRRG